MNRANSLPHVFGYSFNRAVKIFSPSEGDVVPLRSAARDVKSETEGERQAVKRHADVDSRAKVGRERSRKSDKKRKDKDDDDRRDKKKEKKEKVEDTAVKVEKAAEPEGGPSGLVDCAFEEDEAVAKSVSGPSSPTASHRGYSGGEAGEVRAWCVKFQGRPVFARAFY
jgi:hypothetical protein